MFLGSTLVVVFSTSHLEIGDRECEGEVVGDVEGDLLSEWIIDLDLLTIHSSCPPSSTKNVDASKIIAST